MFKDRGTFREQLLERAMSNVTKPTFWCSHDSGFYFRLRGYGLSVDIDLPVLFSERIGKRRVLRIGRTAIQFLTPTF